MGTRTRTITRYVANTFANSSNVQTLNPTSDVTFGNTNITGTVNVATWNANSVAMGNVVANTTGVFPTSNTVSAAIGGSSLRWAVYANTADFSGSVTTQTGLFPTSNTVGTLLGDAGRLWNLYANSINLGSASSLNPTSNAATGALGSTAARWNLNANAVVASVQVSPLSNTVGTSLGTPIQRWVLHANSVTSSAGVYPMSNTVGTALGAAAQQWYVYANTVLSYTGIYPSTNTAGQALGSSTQRWVLNANTGNFSGILTTTANVSVTGSVLVTGAVQSNTTIGIKSTASISTNVLTIDVAAASTYEVSLNANITTLTINNVQSSGYISHFILVFIADGTARSVTWPASFKWTAGQAPTLTSTLNKRDAFVFFTYDGGTTWQASVVVQNA